MRVASYDLCKELNQLMPELNTADFYYVSYEDERVYPARQVVAQLVSAAKLGAITKSGYARQVVYVPAYDTDLLFSLMPRTCSEGVHAHTTVTDHLQDSQGQQYFAAWECDSGEHVFFYAGTPASALAKVLIQLKNIGIA